MGKVPDQVLANGVDLKLAVVPVRVWLGVLPMTPLPSFTGSKMAAAQRAMRPVVAQTCIRLI